MIQLDYVLPMLPQTIFSLINIGSIREIYLFSLTGQLQKVSHIELIWLRLCDYDVQNTTLCCGARSPYSVSYVNIQYSVLLGLLVTCAYNTPFSLACQLRAHTILRSPQPVSYVRIQYSVLLSLLVTCAYNTPFSLVCQLRARTILRSPQSVSYVRVQLIRESCLP